MWSLFTNWRSSLIRLQLELTLPYLLFYKVEVICSFLSLNVSPSHLSLDVSILDMTIWFHIKWNDFNQTYWKLRAMTLCAVFFNIYHRSFQRKQQHIGVDCNCYWLKTVDGVALHLESIYCAAQIIAAFPGRHHYIKKKRPCELIWSAGVNRNLPPL